MTTLPERHARILDFLMAADGLKRVDRQIHIGDGSRHENDAEHSWHMALFAMLLTDEVDPGIDRLRVLEMVLVHDLVEVIAGDVGAFDDPALLEGKQERERAAAAELFGLLPDDLAVRLCGLWEEFEAGVGAEAGLARALDRLQPCVLGVMSKGKAWRESGAGRERVTGFMTKARAYDPLIDRMFAALFARADHDGIWLGDQD